MNVNAKENFLEAVRFGKPDHVPMDCEPIWYGLQLEGNFRAEDWTDAWGVRWEVGLEGTVPFPKVNPLPSLDELADYEFPGAADLVLGEHARAELAAVDRGEKLVIGHLTYLLYERAWAVMGMDAFLMTLVTHPAEAHAFLHAIADYDRKVFERYLELGVDAVGFSEDLGTQRALMMSPAMFRRFLLPEYAYMFEPVLRAGKMIHFHSCGRVDQIARDLAGIGVTVLNPIQARANDLAQVKADTFGRTALHGGINSGLLEQGTPEQVRAEVKRVMEVLKPGGGYVCGPDQGLPTFRKENVEALYETAREAGRY